MTKVLIAVDDSATSISAAKTAHRLFGDDADYVVLNVSPTPMVWGDDAYLYGVVYPVAIPMGGADGQPFAQSTRAQKAEAVHTAEDVAAAAGLDEVTPIGDTGDAAHAIVKAATDHHADVIVVGSHERGWFSRLIMPSVSGFVIRESDIPVLVAR